MKSKSGKEPRPKKTCQAIALNGGSRNSAQPSSTSGRDSTADMIRRIHSLEMNRARNISPEYARKTFASSVSRYLAITFAAKDERRRHGSSPPAVRGETAPAASPITNPRSLAIFRKTPPTGMRPPRRSTIFALLRSKRLWQLLRKTSSAISGSKRDGYPPTPRCTCSPYGQTKRDSQEPNVDRENSETAADL